MSISEKIFQLKRQFSSWNLQFSGDKRFTCLHYILDVIWVLGIWVYFCFWLYVFLPIKCAWHCRSQRWSLIPATSRWPMTCRAWVVSDASSFSPSLFKFRTGIRLYNRDIRPFVSFVQTTGSYCLGEFYNTFVNNWYTVDLFFIHERFILRYFWGWSFCKYKRPWTCL